MIVQIDEVTTPAEARALGAMGVDHIGVLVGEGSFPREQTIEKAREIFAAVLSGSKASALSLSHDVDLIVRLTAALLPDILHLGAAPQHLSPAQLRTLKAKFPQISLMRSIPVVDENSIADSPLLRPGERGFNFRTVRTDHSRATGVGYQNTQAPVLPTQVPITFGDTGGTLGGDGNGPVYVSLDSPFIQLQDGTAQIDRLGTSNVAPLLVGGQINPGLSENHIQVIKDTHGKTSQLSQADLDALVLYLKSLQ